MALLLTFCGGIARNNLAWSWLVTLLTTLGVFMKGWVDVRNTARKKKCLALLTPIMKKP